MDDPQWSYRSYVVYATFPNAGEDGSSVRRFAYDARNDRDDECVGWSETLYGCCFLHYAIVVEAVAVAERDGATDITIRHVELGAPVTPEELLALKRQQLFGRIEREVRIGPADHALFVGLTQEDVALLFRF